MNITEIFDDNITDIVNNTTEIINYDNDNNFLTIEISFWYLLISTIPCFLSIICCLSFLLYSFFKVLKNKIYLL